MNAELAPQIAATIPTFNEPELLARCVQSLRDEDPSLLIVVGNAGDPLPPELAAKVVELKLPGTSFWTESMRAAVEKALELGAEAVLWMNADCRLMPGSLARLRALASSDQKVIAASVAYEEDGSGAKTLIYARQDDLGILRYGKIGRLWAAPSEAPAQPYRTDLIGGQGVLIPAELARALPLDPANFPQYAGDHDFWLGARALGWTIWVDPQAAVVNGRGFNSRTKSRLENLVWRMTSPMASESGITMWRLRRKHLPFPVAVLSWWVAFLMRWTLGLPKILKRY